MAEQDNAGKDPGEQANLVAVDVNELAELCALDTELFGQTYFPRAVRNNSPDFHGRMDQLLDSEDRFVSIQVFRGGAKTTKFRVYMAKRISYGLARTILLVSKSQAHAAKTLMWIRNAVEKNKHWSQTFGLKKGAAKWNDEELEITHGVLGHTIWIVGMGITGSTRGLNFEDYRPDLILVDDVVDEENSNTPEACDKIKKLVHGALKYSLAPKVDNIYSKLVILQTPQAFGDISEQAKKDPLFKTMRCGCWTPETENLPVNQQISAWEQRFPTEDLRADKIASIAKNELSIFSREMECKLVTPEDALFRTEWIKYYGEGQDVQLPPLSELSVTLAIDPVPPPSPQQVAKGYAKKDFEALVAVGKWRTTGKMFVLETSFNRGHDPSWTVAEFFRMAQRWQPTNVVVEAVAYQRVLAWLLRLGMTKLGRYWPITEMTDKRSKYDRINQGMKGPLSEGALYVHPSMTELISQITHYANVEHDDVLEATAVACADLQGKIANEQSDDGHVVNEDDIPDLEYARGCP